VEFITLWTFSQSWALKNLPNQYWANVEVAAKHSVMEVSWTLSSSATFVEGGQAIEKDKQAESLYPLHFVSVPAKWVRTGRQNVLNLYTNKAYYAEVFIE